MHIAPATAFNSVDHQPGRSPPHAGSGSVFAQRGKQHEGVFELAIGTSPLDVVEVLKSSLSFVKLTVQPALPGSPFFDFRHHPSVISERQGRLRFAASSGVYAGSDNQKSNGRK